MHPWRERLTRWFTPLARRNPLSPNAITTIALILNLVAAWFLYTRHFLVGMVFIGIAGLADAFDGIVARVQNKSTRFGDFLDHFFDRVSDAAIAVTWMIGSSVRLELIAIGMIVVMLNGYVGTQIEASFGRRSYEGLGRGEFVLALMVFPIVSTILVQHVMLTALFAGLTIPEWLTIALTAVALLGIVQRMARAARLDEPR
jgi:archaetidylinositol phosphate synthase